MNTVSASSDSMTSRLPLMWLLLAAACSAWAFSLYPAVPVERDAGTYLPRALHILDGVAPFVPGYASQTPFSFYMLAGWAALFGRSFAQAMLCVYVFHALNAALVFAVCRTLLGAVRNAVVTSGVLALSYFCSVFLLDGKTLVLEPFVVFFVLLAYLSYVSIDRPALLRYVVAGVFLGCAVMTKQHAAFISVGFAGMVLADRGVAGRGVFSVGTLGRVALMAACAVAVFFAWVVWAGVGVREALVLFGVIGGKAAGYAGQKDFLSGIVVVVRKLFQTSWLFLPLVLYCARWALRPGLRSVRGALWPVMLGCMIPLLVRQFGHYYQYVLPFGFIAWALVARDAGGVDGREETTRDAAQVVLWSALGAALGASALRLAAVRLDEAGINNLFLGILFVPLVLWFSRRGVEFLRARIAVVLACAMVAVPLVQGAGIDPEKYLAKQQVQRERAAMVNQVFAPGSTVLAAGWPEINVTAGFVNPHVYYSWSFYPHQVDDWRTVPNVVMRDRTAYAALIDELTGLGFVELAGPNNEEFAYLNNPNPAGQNPAGPNQKVE